MEETWKDIKGYEGLYKVSNLGRVKSLNYNKTKKERILKQNPTKRGYVHVDLCNKGKVITRNVHRLVAEAFIPNPNNFPIINHKQEERKDLNCVDNLEWCTQKYNINYGTRTEKVRKKLKGKKNLAAKLRLSKKVYQYTPGGQFVKEWQSVQECVTKGFTHVSECCLGKRRTNKGYKWSYELIKEDI